ncbi:MAG TPA: hypothetical protein VIY29_10420 [Ktedonobacteraceae bacterium]
MFSGILGIIAGLAVLRHPLYATILVGTLLIIIVTIQGLVIGAVGLYQAFSGAGWGTGILAALSVIISILLLTNVVVATLFLPFVMLAS